MSEAMYKGQEDQAGADQAAQGDQAQDSETVDAEFEEVKSKDEGDKK